MCFLFYRLGRLRAVNNCYSGLKLWGTISGIVEKLVMEMLKSWGYKSYNHLFDCLKLDSSWWHLKSKQFLCFINDMWLGILHHVCGEHEWDGGMCSHGPLTLYHPMTSKAAKELWKIVLDRRWLKSLEHYVRFRYVFSRISMILIAFLKLYQLCPLPATLLITTEVIKINFLPIFLFPLT